MSLRAFKECQRLSVAPEDEEQTTSQSATVLPSLFHLDLLTRLNLAPNLATVFTLSPPFIHNHGSRPPWFGRRSRAGMAERLPDCEPAAAVRNTSSGGLPSISQHASRQPIYQLAAPVLAPRARGRCGRHHPHRGPLLGPHGAEGSPVVGPCRRTRRRTRSTRRFNFLCGPRACLRP